MELHEMLTESSMWLWPQMANHLWQATFFTLLAVGVVALLGRGPARARYFVWLIASAKFALPSVLLVLSLKGIGVELSSLLGLSKTSDGVPVIVQFAEPVNQFNEVIVGINAVEAHSEVYCVMTAVWISGSLFFFVLWMRRRFQFARTVRMGTTSIAGREIEALNRVLKWLSVKKEIRLAISPSVVEPGVWGIAKPTVVLPEKLDSQLSDAELEAVIMHEIVHVERRDNLTATLQMILCCIFWFHPLVWLIDRRMLAERERACDERVVELGGASGVYASSLLKVLQFCLGLKTAGVSSAAGSNLRRRIEQILDNNFVSKISISHRILIGALTVLVMIFPIATVLISRDSVIAGQTEMNRITMQGISQHGALDDYNQFFRYGSKQKMMMEKEQVSNFNKELEEAPFISIKSKIYGKPPLKILDARIKTAKVPKLYTKEGVEWAPSVNHYAIRPHISLVNNTNKRITHIFLDFRRKDILQSIISHFISIEPGAYYDTGLSGRLLLWPDHDPKSLVVNVGAVAFDNGEVWRPPATNAQVKPQSDGVRQGEAVK